MTSLTASRTGLSLLAVSLGVFALAVGPAAAQDLGNTSGFCCYTPGSACDDSDATSCASDGFLFMPYAEDSGDICDAFCAGSPETCPNGEPDYGECGPEGTCLEDCGEYMECYEYTSESECYFVAGCHWYYDDYGYFGGDFCADKLLFCGDGYCTDTDGEDEENCPRDCRERCGNGVLEGEEECEPDENDPDCNAECSYDRCGDGVVAYYEYCDPDTGITDDPYVAFIGNEYCNEYCEFSWCGDGYVDEWLSADGEFFVEDCDDGNNSDADGCASDCTLESCGNDIRDVIDVSTGELEECDDGNTDDGDGCSASCTQEYCGNGIVDAGEDCDDYWYDENGWPMWDLYVSVFGQTEQCNIDCTIPFCGDGIKNEDAGEECDEADENSDLPSAFCRTDCTYGACGDGIIDDEYGEECDDGLANADDAFCNLDCHINACGNGDVEEGFEECDPYAGTGLDGTTENPDMAAGMSAECTDECVWSFCGDGVVNDEAEEECDPDTGADSWYYASDNSSDCTYYCTTTYCGDGIVNEYDNEECDPGYSCENGDDCTYSGVCDDGSACDVRSTEECTATCEFNTTDLLCCFDYDFENGYFLYEGESGYTSDDCDADFGRPEYYEGELTEQADVDYWCGYPGACCYVDDEGYSIAEGSTWEDCDFYEGEYIPAMDADADRDGQVSREEAWNACEYKVEYVCSPDGGTERRNDGGETSDDMDAYVVDGLFVTNDPNDSRCDLVYLFDTCESISLADAMINAEDFFPSYSRCLESID